MGVTSSFPRVTLFIPGASKTVGAWNLALEREGLRIIDDQLAGTRYEAPVGVEWIENDGGFGAAFSFGTVGAASLAKIEAAPSALVLTLPGDLRQARSEAVSLAESLREAGALAVRVEQSKLGWEIDKWLELMGSEEPRSWHRAAVIYLPDEGLASCGMHAFSLPDVLLPGDAETGELQRIGTELNVYQLAEDPVLRPGQTFRPDEATQRRVMERWPTALYPSDHPCHNPYGVFRLGPPGGSARDVSELTFTFMPALGAVLMALEAKAGRALTRAEVEGARDGGHCIAMEPRDAQTLERSRGYADLDPELVWEQWQLMRKH